MTAIGPTPPRLFGRAYRRLRGQVGAALVRHHTLNDLERLDERQLDDMGIARSDFDRIAREAGRRHLYHTRGR